LKVRLGLALSPPIGTTPPTYDGPVTGGGPRDELDDLAAELDATFLGELGERLPAMNAALAALDAGTSGPNRSATLEELTRHAHSVKGGAMLVRRQEIARLAGALEARFAADEAAPTARPVSREAGEALAVIARLSTADRPVSDAPAELPGGPPTAEIDRLIAALERHAD
jgi:chemotaxis protein histidine kinase CheA